MTARPGKGPVVIASRTSSLARWQAEAVRRMLSRAWPGRPFEIRLLSTEGDRRLDQALPQIGGKGVFTLALEEALLAGDVDLAVHSLKDLPTQPSPGLILGSVPAREDPRDVLVAGDGQELSQLPSGAVVGTSSPRRQAQLLALRPDLKVEWIRGNVETRVRKVLNGDYDGAVLAAAGLLRLGLDQHVTTWFPTDEFLPAPGQGALGVQCRDDDPDVVTLLRAIENKAVRLAVESERAFLAALESGCSAPVGAIGEGVGGHVRLRGLVASTDGRRLIHLAATGDDPEALGQSLAEEALRKGAAELVHA